MDENSAIMGEINSEKGEFSLEMGEISAGLDAVCLGVVCLKHSNCYIWVGLDGWMDLSEGESANNGK